MSKSDQIRALRERAYEARLAAPIRHVINAPQAISKSPAERQAKWREANTELNRLRAISSQYWQKHWEYVKK